MTIALRVVQILLAGVFRWSGVVKGMLLGVDRAAGRGNGAARDVAANPVLGALCVFVPVGRLSSWRPAVLDDRPRGRPAVVTVSCHVSGCRGVFMSRNR